MTIEQLTTTTVLVLHPDDSVAVAPTDLAAGAVVNAEGTIVTLRDDIPRGHKIALRDISAGDNVLKYGYPIGHATEAVPTGGWIHTHNLATNLGPDLDYVYEPEAAPLKPGTPTRTFQGYRRADGRVGVRNDLYIVPTVGCINGLLDGFSAQFRAEHPDLGSFDSIIVTKHPYGCSQLGGDLDNTKRILQDITKHPNAAGVLVVGLGCENLQMDILKSDLGEYDPSRVKFMIAQQVSDEFESALDLIEQINEAAAGDHREEVPLSELKIGLKCGGSDGFSGITANPLVGGFADYLIAQGGSAVLTEVPEMFGAEQILMARAKDTSTFSNIVNLINSFKAYFRRYDQPIYENPSPGNKAGGITTLEEKSLGCTQKAGTAEVQDVLGYGERIRTAGLSLLQSPGNDLVSSSALASSGCQIVLFTTGRGTPFGTYVPTIKVATNTPLAEKKPRWIDFNAGQLLDTPRQDVLDEFIELVINVANGAATKNELNHMQEIAIFKDGVTE